MKKYTFLAWILPLALIAQQDAYLSLYQLNMPLINPAYSGAEGNHVFSLTSRNQWSNLEASPRTTAFSYSTAVGKNVGLGISILSDEIFIEEQTTLTADFSYQLTMANEAALYLGIKAGGNSYSADPTALRGYDSDADPVKRPLSRFNPNLGVGFLYQASNWWVSGALPRLFNARRHDDVVIQARDRMHTYFYAGAVFSVSDKFSIKPNIMYRNTKSIGAVTDLGVKASYNNTFDLGFSVRTGDIFSIQALFNINENLTLGYSYDTYGADQLSGLNLKAHEIAMRFKFGSSTEAPKLEEVPEE